VDFLPSNESHQINPEEGVAENQKRVMLTNYAPRKRGTAAQRIRHVDLVVDADARTIPAPSV
jgi:hypothetical protein